MDLSRATCESGQARAPSPGAEEGASRADAAPEEATTPTKRNKRKMSEPRKLTDFSVKNLCKKEHSNTSRSKKRRKNSDVDKMQNKDGLTVDSVSDHSARSSSATPEAGRIVHPAFAVPGFAMPMAVPLIPGYSIPGYPPYPGSVPVGAPVSGGMPPSGGVSMPPSPTTSTASSEGTKVGSKRKSNSANNTSAIVTSTSNSKKRKNYKNMTRERRIEANARERSRVHLISAAFENLRRAVPSYSYNQRLSKLAILRIACSYIIALARLADQDYTQDHSNLSFSECVDLCTRTIQTEGRARRRH